MRLHAAALRLALCLCALRAAAFPALLAPNGSVSIETAFDGDLTLNPGAGARPGSPARRARSPKHALLACPLESERCWHAAHSFPTQPPAQAP